MTDCRTAAARHLARHGWNVAGMLNKRRAMRSGPNLIRHGCETNERNWLALRLTDQELYTNKQTTPT